MTDNAEKQSHLVLVNALVEKNGKLLISQRSYVNIWGRSPNEAVLAIRYTYKTMVLV